MPAGQFLPPERPGQTRTSSKLAKVENEQALADAERAQRFRLDPQDRLAATARLCAAYLHLARSHQADAFRLASEALSGNGLDERRMALSQAHAERSRDYVRRGLIELSDMLKRAPSVWGSGQLEHGFYMVLTEFARARGDSVEAEADKAAAVASLRHCRRHIVSRPFVHSKYM